jgi:hypothetical protein
MQFPFFNATWRAIMNTRRIIPAVLSSLALTAPPVGAAADAVAPPPQHLRDTKLFVAGSTRVVRPEILPYSPQYPLWSDGASKRRWILLPPGSAIDASKADAWEFPTGTRLWKEFSHGGRPIETRYIERQADGSWRFAAYVWNADGSDATLAPIEGARLRVDSAPGGTYVIPSQSDCRVCHEAAAAPVLGVGALQLSPDRDPLAPHAEPARPEHVDLAGLIARDMVRGLPQRFVRNPPRIAATTPAARAALGYLHGNCGHCHNSAGPLASLELALAYELEGGRAGSPAALDSTVGRPSRFRPRENDAVAQRIAPGTPGGGVLAMRMKSRNPLTQMPPLGTRVPDAEAISLIERWINHDLKP